ncbi:PilN domain-containing protein [Lysinibacillus xylanilyticus]|uniref:PilN domain-containing protein n=1 Tax=Lysinibacillus xylanilyticus TaxID=582475 RepID=A0ABT4EKY9_9BACI|nr:PilN domain-containing protein [Lysinibacillus xylanilyticus]MCY9545643.1 PilN domain-containing protein [Lysinibacillus xylanilyticus]
MVPEINLLPNLEKKHSTPTLIYVVFIILIGMIVGYMIFLFFQARIDLTKLSAQEVELSSQHEQLQIELDGKRNLNQGSLEQSVQFVENVSYPVTPLIDEIQVLLPEQTYFRKYVFGEENVEITADFETMSAISSYLEKLTASPYFNDVQVDTISNFDVSIGNKEEESAKDRFKEVPRYSATITLGIDFKFLAGGRES